MILAHLFMSELHNFFTELCNAMALTTTYFYILDQSCGNGTKVSEGFN